jgi:SnoaL-like domain
LNPRYIDSSAVMADRVAHEYVRLLNAKQYTQIASLFAEETEFIGQGVSLSGRAALADFYPRTIGALSPDRVSIRSSVSQGPTCVVEIEAVYREDGSEFSRWASDVFTVDSDGFITRLAIYVRSTLRSVRPTKVDEKMGEGQPNEPRIRDGG